MNSKIKPVNDSALYLVAQELAGQGPEGVQVEETARQIDQLELFHLRVDEELSGGERRSAWSGGVGDIHSWKIRTTDSLSQFHHLNVRNTQTFKAISVDSVLALYQFHKHQ